VYYNSARNGFSARQSDITSFSNDMTIRKHSKMAQRGLFYALAFAGLTGCSSIDSLLEGNRVDYKPRSAARSDPVTA
jgi:hypothetical protein